MKTLVVLFLLFAFVSSAVALPLVYSYYGYPAAYGYSYGYYDPLYSPYTAAYVLPWYKR